MKIAYIRVSAIDQNPGRQMEALKKYDIEKIYTEKISGASDQRPELKKLLSFARTGDTVYIESISRLARNTREFLNIVEHFKQNQVQLVSLKENIDTATPQGEFMLSVFAALSQLERDSIRQRQREGIDLALAEKRPYGRPSASITEKFRQAYNKWKEGKITAVEAMKLSGIKKTTFYKLAIQYEKSMDK